VDDGLICVLAGIVVEAVKVVPFDKTTFREYLDPAIGVYLIRQLSYPTLENFPTTSFSLYNVMSASLISRKV
jgi:hypothetical protein